MPISFSRPRGIDAVGWCLLAAAMIFAMFVRVRLREFPLERDEGEFAYAGQLLLEGVPPYKLAYNMKLPGTYIAYAALMAVPFFGQTTAGIHLGLLVVNLATIWLLYRLVREMFDPFSAGMAAVAYAVLSASQSLLGMAAHATHFVAFFALLGTYLLWRHLQSGKWSSAALSGLMMGIAFLMKQQGVFMMVFGGAVLLLLGLLLPSYPRRKLPLTVAAYSLAALLPYGLVCLWLWRAGVWSTFWFWTVEYASKYVASIPLQYAPQMFVQSASHIASDTWPLLLLALIGAVAVAVVGRRTRGARIFAYGFAFFAFLCVCPGFYFREHYFIVLLPAVAMFAGVGCRLIWDLSALAFAASPAADPKPASAARQKRPQVIQSKSAQPQPMARDISSPVTLATASIVVAIVIALSVGGTLWVQRMFFFVWPPLEACHFTYMSNPFIEAPEIAKYLKAHTSPDDTIAVIGSEPEIFFDAHRRSATGDIYTYGLVEVQPLAAQMQQKMVDEIEAKKPKYIVFANVRCSWLTVPRSQTAICDWALSYINANYEIVGAYSLNQQLGTDAYWDSRLRSFPRSEADKFDAVWPGPHGIFAAVMKEPKVLDPILKYAAQQRTDFEGALADPRVRAALESDNDIGWKLSLYPGVRSTYKYCTLPFLFVCRRK